MGRPAETACKRRSGHNHCPKFAGRPVTSAGTQNATPKVSGVLCVWAFLVDPPTRPLRLYPGSILATCKVAFHPVVSKLPIKRLMRTTRNWGEKARRWQRRFAVKDRYRKLLAAENLIGMASPQVAGRTVPIQTIGLDWLQFFGVPGGLSVFNRCLSPESHHISGVILRGGPGNARPGSGWQRRGALGKKGTFTAEASWIL